MVERSFCAWEGRERSRRREETNVWRDVTIVGEAAGMVSQIQQIRETRRWPGGWFRDKLLLWRICVPKLLLAV